MTWGQPCSQLSTTRPSFTYHLHDDLTGSCSCIKIKNNDVLPGPQKKLVSGEGNREGVTLDLSPQVTVPVVFSRIAGVMLPRGISRYQIVPERAGVGSQSRFVFDNQHRRGGMSYEYRHDSSLQAGLGQTVSDSIGNVLHVRPALHVHRERACEDRHQGSLPERSQKTLFVGREDSSSSGFEYGVKDPRGC